jgi:APA family basic amino acid/polyamine antiporter
VTAEPDRSSVTYARRIGLFSGTLSVVGGIIGSGIFLNPAIVAQRVGSGGLALGIWVAGGVVAVLGGLIYSEWGSRLPKAGGPYAYLRAGLGPFWGFLFAWAMLLVIGAGSAAAVGYTFASYAAVVFHLPPSAVVPLAAGAIALFATINVFGVQFGAWTQNVFVILKLAALGLLIFAGLFLTPGGPPPACPDCAPVTPPVGLSATIVAIGGALVPVLFAYGGWQQTNFIGEEIIDPRRNLPRVLLAGVAIVVATYLLANGAYLRTLGVAGLARSQAPAADTLGLIWGEPGRRLISLGVMISTAGFLNTASLLQPRVYQAMARDGLFFQTFARLQPRWRTPVVAIGFQAGWSIVLLSSRSYGALLNYTVFADWIFFGATALALIAVRRREPSPASGGFLAPGYPWTVLVFAAAALYVVIGSISSNLGYALRGASLLAAGIPVYWYWSRRSRSPSGAI